MYEISPLLLIDMSAAYAVECLGHAIPWSNEILYNSTGPNYRNIKLVLEGYGLVGFVISTVVGDEASLLNIVVHPKQRGNGYGRALLEYLIREFSLEQVSMLWLEVRVGNVSALHLYRALGFCDICSRDNYYPTKGKAREDALVMALTIM
jgi:ribosomal-protein-alanine N-acetyltransferase